MSGVGGLFILGREAAAWFGGLAIPSKLSVITIAFATASVGVAVVAPDALPISPFTSSHSASLFPATGTSAKPAEPVNPSIVASAVPSSGRASAPTTAATTRPSQTAPTVPGAGETKPTGNASSNATKAATTKKATATTSASASKTSVYYKNCEAAWEAGAAPIPSNKPGYRIELDPDHNGVACEKRS